MELKKVFFLGLEKIKGFENVLEMCNIHKFIYAEFYIINMLLKERQMEKCSLLV